MSSSPQTSHRTLSLLRTHFAFDLVILELESDVGYHQGYQELQGYSSATQCNEDLGEDKLFLKSGSYSALSPSTEYGEQTGKAESLVRRLLTSSFPFKSSNVRWS